MLTIEELKCDLLDVLQNDDCTPLEELKSFCREFRSCVTDKIKKTLLYEKDCNNKRSDNAMKISDLQQKIDSIQSNIDAITLQQKGVDNKILNGIKIQEILENDLKEAEKQKKALSSEVDDLRLELEEKRRNKILQWEARKRALAVYKENLDIHLSLEEENDCQRIKFNFFQLNEETRDKYCVYLLHNKDGWKVERIKPKLKKEYLNELSITDSPEHSKVLDITLFLCEVRNIFLKHYIKTSEKS